MNDTVIQNQEHQSARKEWLKKIGIPLALTILLVLMFMPTPEGLTIQGQKSHCYFLWCVNSLGLWLNPYLFNIFVSHYFIAINSDRCKR